ncbi:MAG: L,D-transpeptidase family protein [Prosthecobacter sp.]|nr:L,D-transpeptidase family protein [Prosthecobacter sp.]
MLRFLFRTLAAVGVSLLSIGCSSWFEDDVPGRTDPRHSYWIGDGVPGSPRMVISLSQQRVFYYKGDRMVGASPISSGRESHMTKLGSYRIIEKDIDHRSSWYGSYARPDGFVVRDNVDVRKDPRPPGTAFVGADMRYFMRITGAIGMHQGCLPGYPASHGCIRLPGRMAAIFFHETPLGTPIKITKEPVTEPAQPEVPVAPPKPAPAILAAAPAPQVQQAKTPAPPNVKLGQANMPASAPAPKALKAATTPKKQVTSASPNKGQVFQHKPKPKRVTRGSTIFLD